jgi:tetratricopeptide (TPR) repeat protein
MLINIIVVVRSPVGGHNLVSLAEFGLIDRFMQAMYIWAYYIWRPWYPFNLSPVYTTLVSFNPLSPLFVISAVLVIGIITLLIFLRRRQPLGLALGACYFVLLVPVLGILEHPYYPCDRYSLIVSVLWSVLLAALLANYKTKPLLRNITLVLSIIVIAGLGLLTFRQTQIWNNSVSLFEYMIRTLGDDPYVYEPHCRLGIFLAQQGQYSQADVHLRKGIELIQSFQLKPNPEMLYNMGSVYNSLGRYPEAIEAFSQAIRIDPNYGDAYVGLGNTLGKLGHHAEAEQACKLAIKIKPDSAEVYYTLGAAYFSQGLWAQAAEASRHAISLKPDYAQAYYNLGLALLRSGDRDAALAQCEILKKLNPDLANALLSDIQK